MGVGVGVERGVLEVALLCHFHAQTLRGTSRGPSFSPSTSVSHPCVCCGKCLVPHNLFLQFLAPHEVLSTRQRSQHYSACIPNPGVPSQ